MDSKALDKAHSRLRVAGKALSELESCKSHQEFEDVWSTFLVAAKNVYTALEQGSKVSPQARQWFGAKKQNRRDDPLLQYLFQARDDDEHGLEPVTELAPGSIDIGVTKPASSSDFTIDHLSRIDGKIQVSTTSHDGKPVLVEITPSHTKLRTVTARGGIKYTPPTLHQGKRLESNLPIPVGRLGLAYLEELVREAEGVK